VFAAIAFLWALTLGVSPELHQRVHPDANRVDHSCVATLVSAGQLHHSTPAPLVVVPIPHSQPVSIPVLLSTWVASPFLSASIFEHAPPRRISAS
jgi:hypothetical protein